MAVTDQGQGIAAGDQERIFERFYRVDAARSRATGGTGLGLAIVKHVVDNHGGTVSSGPRSGRGSTFTIRSGATAAASPRRLAADRRPTVDVGRPDRSDRPEGARAAHLHWATSGRHGQSHERPS